MTLLLMSLLDDTLYTVPIFNDISCVVDDTFTDLFSNKIMVSVVKIAKHEIKTTKNLFTMTQARIGRFKRTESGRSHEKVKVGSSKVPEWTVQDY